MQCIPPQSRSYIIKSYHPVLALPEPFTSLALKGSYCCKSVAYYQTDPWWLCPSFGFGTQLDFSDLSFRFQHSEQSVEVYMLCHDHISWVAPQRIPRVLAFHCMHQFVLQIWPDFPFSGGLYIFLEIDAWKILHLCCTLLMRALMERGSSYRGHRSIMKQRDETKIWAREKSINLPESKHLHMLLVSIVYHVKFKSQSILIMLSSWPILYICMYCMYVYIFKYHCGLTFFVGPHHAWSNYPYHHSRKDVSSGSSWQVRHQ